MLPDRLRARPIRPVERLISLVHRLVLLYSRLTIHVKIKVKEFFGCANFWWRAHPARLATKILVIGHVRSDEFRVLVREISRHKLSHLVRAAGLRRHKRAVVGIEYLLKCHYTVSNRL